jgi:hypothetical protein
VVNGWLERTEIGVLPRLTLLVLGGWVRGWSGLKVERETVEEGGEDMEMAVSEARIPASSV